MGTKYTGYSKSRKFVLLHNPRVNSIIALSYLHVLIGLPKCCLSCNLPARSVCVSSPVLSCMLHILTIFIIFGFVIIIKEEQKSHFIIYAGFPVYFAVAPSSALCSHTSSILLLGLPKERKVFRMSYEGDI